MSYLGGDYEDKIYVLYVMFVFPVGHCYSEEDVGVTCNKYCSDKIGKHISLTCNKYCSDKIDKHNSPTCNKYFNDTIG